MKGVILKHIIVFILVMISGSILMNVSQRVQIAEREVTRYDRDIAREGESIRILKAEWAYLNNPSRLEALASGGLGLISPNTAQLVSDMDETKSSVFVPVPTKSPLHMDISFSADTAGGDR